MTRIPFLKTRKRKQNLFHKSKEKDVSILQPKKYRIKAQPVVGAEQALSMQAGDVVYECLKYDYGLANDDSRVTGVLHTSVTLEADGDCPSFTIPVHLLEEIK